MKEYAIELVKIISFTHISRSGDMGVLYMEIWV